MLLMVVLGKFATVVGCCWVVMVVNEGDAGGDGVYVVTMMVWKDDGGADSE